MVVIVLIGILSASILPVMKGTFEDARLRSTGRELLNVFQLANSRAVTLNEIQRVRIDQANGRYSLESPGREAGAQNGFVPVADLPGGAGTLDSRIAISLSFGSASSTDQTAAEPESSAQPASSTGATALAFNPDGTADACEIRLQDRDGFRLSLQINPVTARVRVRELPRQ